MYIPDHVISRKVKEYDPRLYIRWSTKRECFELWRHMEDGRRVCVTPIVQSIYDTKSPATYVELDDRIIWWLYSADSWRKDKITDHAREDDARWKEFVKNSDRQRLKNWYDLGKDVYSHANAFFATKHGPKNSGLPTWNKHKQTGSWTRPDSQSMSAPRVFSRSRANALRYNYGKR